MTWESSPEWRNDRRVFAGSGTIDAELQNGGWLEPAGSGFSITGDYTQLREGNLRIAENVATGAEAPVRISGAATFAGSLWMTAQ